AAQDEAAEAVAQRQRIAIRPVAGAKLALEVRGPDLIHRTGRLRPRARDRGLMAAPRSNQAARLQLRTLRRSTRPRRVGLLPRPDRQQLLGPPVRMALAV